MKKRLIKSINSKQIKLLKKILKYKLNEAEFQKIVHKLKNVKYKK